MRCGIAYQVQVAHHWDREPGGDYNFASFIETVSDLRAYGGRSLHEQSHGESFVALFTNRFEQGLYMLDEPEAALSPQ